MLTIKHFENWPSDLANTCDSRKSKKPWQENIQTSAILEKPLQTVHAKKAIP